jgi:phosphate starvation-inducible PhoH-like protein
MMQVEKIIKLESVDLISLLGFNDANLKPIEDRFNTNITVRGDIVYVQGVIEEVEAVEKVFKEMVFVVNTTGKILAKDVETIIDLTLQGKEIISDNDYDNIVLYSKKDVIKGKTPNQIGYVKSVRENDICFAMTLLKNALQSWGHISRVFMEKMYGWRIHIPH